MSDLIDMDSPVWCLNEEPHGPHRRANRFGGFNECSGRPRPADQMPTTEQIEHAYCDGLAGTSRTRQESAQEFRSWLAAELRTAQASALPGAGSAGDGKETVLHLELDRIDRVTLAQLLMTEQYPAIAETVWHALPEGVTTRWLGQADRLLAFLREYERPVDAVAPEVQAASPKQLGRAREAQRVVRGVKKLLDTYSLHGMVPCDELDALIDSD